MFFARLVVATLSLGAAFAAPVNKVGDVALLAGLPAVFPRTTSVADALAAVTSATQDVNSDLNSLSGAIDGAKAVQLAVNMVKLEDCVDGANTVISKAQGALSLVDAANTFLALKQVGEKLQSVQNLKSIKGVGTQLAPIKASVDRLVTEVTNKVQEADLDELHNFAGPVPSLFSLLL